MSALNTELAAPVSIKVSGTVMVVPLCVSVAVMNASSPRKCSCMDAPNSEPAALLDIELDVGCMDEAELALGVLPMQLAVALHCGASVDARRIDDGDPVEDPSVTNGARLERFDHEPLVRIYRAYLGPTHAARVTIVRRENKFSSGRQTTASKRRTSRCCVDLQWATVPSFGRSRTTIAGGWREQPRNVLAGARIVATGPLSPSSSNGPRTAYLVGRDRHR
jgi:hypothetical protein